MWGPIAYNQDVLLDAPKYTKTRYFVIPLFSHGTRSGLKTKRRFLLSAIEFKHSYFFSQERAFGRFRFLFSEPAGGNHAGGAQKSRALVMDAMCVPDRPEFESPDVKMCGAMEESDDMRAQRRDMEELDASSDAPALDPQLVLPSDKALEPPLALPTDEEEPERTPHGLQCPARAYYDLLCDPKFIYPNMRAHEDRLAAVQPARRRSSKQPAQPGVGRPSSFDSHLTTRRIYHRFSTTERFPQRVDLEDSPGPAGLLPLGRIGSLDRAARVAPRRPDQRVEAALSAATAPGPGTYGSPLRLVLGRSTSAPRLLGRVGWVPRGRSGGP